MVGPYKLTRFNMYPAITINGTPASGVSSGKAMAEMEILSNENLPKDMSYAWSGVSLQEKNSSGQIGPILTMALTFVYLFLVALYSGGCAIYTCPFSINGFIKRKKKVKSNILIWLPSTSASVMQMIRS